MSGTILIVEDDRDGRELMGELLSLSGYRTLLAEDGLAALQVLESEKPCVILLDLMMPRMNGWEFREAQLSDERLRGIPVVVISADGNVERKASDVRASGYLRKPVDVDLLIRTIRTHCAARDPQA